MSTPLALWDGVDLDRLVAAAERWRPVSDGDVGFADGRQRFAAALAATTTPAARAASEAAAVEWLYRLLRANVGRGRRFDLAEVLESGAADCLGYAKLFVALARVVGLDAGVADVVIDNGGRYVPHTVAMVTLSDVSRDRFRRGEFQTRPYRTHRFVDLWYGSADIRHRRLGLEVLEGGEWTVSDVDWERLDSFDGVRPLPDAAATAITLYVRANRLLKADPPEADAAIALYTEAIRLYPHNARARFNRAIAYDSLGRTAEAAADYARALGDESSLIRVLATEHDDVVALMRLDEAAVPEAAQAVYLRAAGFVTGAPMALDAVATELGLSLAAARAAMDAAEQVAGI